MAVSAATAEPPRRDWKVGSSGSSTTALIPLASQRAGGHGQSSAWESGHNSVEALLAKPVDLPRLLTHSFLRLANLESGAFGLLNRYEVALWRQTVQTILALRATRRRW